MTPAVLVCGSCHHAPDECLCPASVRRTTPLRRPQRTPVPSTPVHVDEADIERLRAAGWRQLPSGRWTHPDLPGIAGRRRPFTPGAALTLLDAGTEATP